MDESIDYVVIISAIFFLPLPLVKFDNLRMGR